MKLYSVLLVSALEVERVVRLPGLMEPVKLILLVFSVNFTVRETVTVSSQSASSLMVWPSVTLATASAREGYITPSMEATAAEITKGLKPLVVKVT